MRNSQLSELNVGDKIGIMPVGHYGDRMSWKIVTISKLTKRSIYTDNGGCFSLFTGYGDGNGESRATKLVSLENARRQNRHVKKERSAEALNQIRHHMVALTAHDRDVLKGELGDE